MSKNPMRVLMPATLVLLGAGFVAGLVVSGRLDLTQASSAAPDAAQESGAAIATSTAAGAAAVGALPDLSAIAERALQVSVNIASTNVVRMQVDPFFRGFFGGEQAQAQQSLGSGVVVSPDGYILTNTHVIGNQVESIRVTLPNGRELPARLVGTDSVSDLAVVKIDATDLQTIPWGDSRNLRVAEWVLAIGNPYQLSGTVTLGIVSTVRRSAEQVGTMQDFIQTDAAINPGNSGGALINARGELVGINTMIYSQTGGYQGIGFAIPANAARQIMTELIEHGAVTWGSIGGITLVHIDRNMAARNGLPATGAWVRSIDRNAPAFRAGLRPRDLVVKINDQAVTSVEQIDLAVTRAKVGSTVNLTIVNPNGEQEVLTVPVVARQAQR